MQYQVCKGSQMKKTITINPLLRDVIKWSDTL